MRKRKIAKIIAIAPFIIIAAIFIQTKCAYAGIGVDPASTEVVVSRDEVTKGSFTVTNDESKTMRVKVEPEDWIKAKTGTSSVPIEKWLKLSPMEFDLEPVGARKVEYEITPPPEAKGELVAMVFFATSSPYGAINITSRVGCSIYAAIANTIELGCDIRDITVQKHMAPEADGTRKDKGLSFGLDIENKGNVHIRPTGNIVITAEDGTKYNILIVRSFAVYPGQHQGQTVTWKKEDIPPGKYEAQINLDYGNIYNVDRVLERKKTFVIKKDGSISLQ